MSLDIESLQKNSKDLALITQKQVKQTQHEETKAATLTIGYVISQGTILISISNRSALQCDDWFVPFSLSLLLGVVYLVTFWEAVNRWYHLQYDMESKNLELEAIWVQIHHQHHQHHSHQLPDCGLPEPDRVRLTMRKSFIGILILALMCFQGVMLYACRYFLCHGL